jgi:thiamine monophosphate synthase
VDADNAEEIARAGAAGIAVIRAVMQARHPESAATELVGAVRKGRSGAP